MRPAKPYIHEGPEPCCLCDERSPHEHARVRCPCGAEMLAENAETHIRAQHPGGERSLEEMNRGWIPAHPGTLPEEPFWVRLEMRSGLAVLEAWREETPTSEGILYSGRVAMVLERPALRALAAAATRIADELWLAEERHEDEEPHVKSANILALDERLALEKRQEEDERRHEHWLTCPACSGSGGGETRCGCCAGTGRVRYPW